MSTPKWESEGVLGSGETDTKQGCEAEIMSERGGGTSESAFTKEGRASAV